MPIIANPVKFSKEQLALINKVTSEEGFDHNSWAIDELADLRRYIREHYRDEQRLTCAYCANPVAHHSAAGAPIEHIIPKSVRTDFCFVPTNLCVICIDCNEIKSNQDPLSLPDPLVRYFRRYPASSAAFKIVHPHFDNYREHIVKCDRIYIGLSKKGEWTINLCELNRFLHRFGISQEFVDDLAVIQREEEFFRR